MKNRLSFSKLVFVLALGFNALHCFAQTQAPLLTYRASAANLNRILETKLDITFSFPKQILYGKALLGIQPNVKAANYIELDAKGMIFRKVEMHTGKSKKQLHYTANDKQLRVSLDRVYEPSEKYWLYIEYETNPASASGDWQSALHFINPNGDQKGTPTQIWTSGQPENNSSWFPTIDKPNQKIKQEISITVPAKFKTLSNGQLSIQKTLPGGLRKDTWKMDLPHAPYLFMFAVGEFSIVKDYWKGKEVSYYVEPQFAPDQAALRAAFPNTVEAIDYFSNLLGVTYPWNKYSQIKLRDFSGAMENTTATAFNEDKQGSSRELMDHNYQSGHIHELFHQWFGNYVTAESWANICLNESFADLSEIIWAEYKFGTDVAGDHLLKGMRGYLADEDGWNKKLVRYDYEKPQEVFDGISYQKGGRILNMLRIYLGNEVFYKGLNFYLRRNANKSAEVHDLRLALEDASGMDLNWFFNQWFFGSGHPELDINYGFEARNKQYFVVIKQLQKDRLFKIPIAIDVYTKAGKSSRQIWLTKATDTIKLEGTEKPLLINVDAQKALIAKKTDHKNLSQFTFQYFNAPLFQDRYEAVDAAKDQQDSLAGRTILIAALHDKFYSIRTLAINSLNFKNAIFLNSILPDLLRIAGSDPNHSTRAAAIQKLGGLKDKKYLELFSSLLSSKSYLVKGEALDAIGRIDPQQQFELAKANQAGSKGKLQQVILQSYMNLGNEAQWTYVYDAYTNGNSPVQYAFSRQLADFIKKIKNPSYATAGILAIKEMVIQQKNRSIAPRVILFLNEIKPYKEKLKDTASVEAIEQSISAINLFIQ
ncbi:M1 family metallopeptidase [Pedobacter gandavensis]|uniref:M1 family metallopeptidase n=1 Tax=Pedobacter gandavensis TaxID=2679963 RepID=UPI0029317F9B|nr:M1 family aminopeptidase [Pedobacter gandavensis]